MPVVTADDLVELQQVGVGDRIIITSSRDQSIQVVLVAGITRTMIKTEHSRFRKNDGGEVGAYDSWFRRYIFPMTEAVMKWASPLIRDADKERRKHQAKRLIALEIDRSCVSLEVLEAVVSLLQTKRVS